MVRFCLLALVVLFAGCEPEPQPQTHTLTITAYTSVNCGPCRRNEPRLREIEALVRVTRVDVDQQPQLAAAAGIRAVPTYVIFVDGVYLSYTNDVVTLARWVADYGPP